MAEQVPKRLWGRERPEFELLNGLHERMIDLRRDLVLVAEGIIVATGAMDKKGARAWTKKCFP